MAWIRVCRNHARKKTITGFASSDGCTDAGPKCSQRCAPFMLPHANTPRSISAVTAISGNINLGLLDLRYSTQISPNKATMPNGAQIACLYTNAYGEPIVAFAITADAEK